MTYAPAALTALARYWVSKGGVNLGVVGDVRHKAQGRSYHLGKSQLTADAYSRQTARDRAGLSEAASAIDLGKLDASLDELRMFSIWFVARCRADAPGTYDVREVIYSPDGKVVMRWDRERGVASAPRPGEADSSHLTHTHISLYRDSEKRSKLALFTPYFEAPRPPDTSTKPQEEGVIVVTIEKFPVPRSFTAKANLRRFTATAELMPSIEGPYQGTVDATVAIESTGVPHGSGFLRLSSGGSAGKFVLAAQVELV